jgi:hypothetical protein
MPVAIMKIHINTGLLGSVHENIALEAMEIRVARVPL